MRIVRQVWVHIYRFWPAGILTGVVFFIVAPLWRPGFLFFLDHFMTPEFHLSLGWYGRVGQLDSSLPLYVCMWAVAHLVGTMVMQKLLVSLIFLGSAVSAYVSLSPKLGRLPRTIAASFFIINPFVYERFMAGQIGVLLGYSLLPLLLRLFIDLRNERESHHVMKVVGLWTMQIIFSPHYAVISGVCIMTVTVIETIFSFIQNRVGWWQREHRWLQSLGGIMLCMVLLNIFWIWPVFVYGQAATDIAPTQAVSYRAAADEKYGLATNLLGLYGFWRERTAGSEIILPKDMLPGWPVWFTVFVGGAVIVGLYRLTKERRWRELAILVALGSVSVGLALGPTAPVVGRVNQYLLENIPGFTIVRESQKFIGVLVTVYMILLAYGLDTIIQLSRVRRYHLSATIGFLILGGISIYTWPLWWGGHGQLTPRRYPPVYAEAKRMIMADQSAGTVLILPWHLYVIGHPLAPRQTIVDPAPTYFHPIPVLSSRDAEVEGIPSLNTSAEQTISGLLGVRDATIWYRALKQLGVTYVFVQKVGDTRAHGFDHQPFLVDSRFIPMLEDENAIVFRLE